MNEEVFYLLDEIKYSVKQPLNIMEVCGGQTHAIASLGLEELLPQEITLIHGPGCPVCVTDTELIEAAIEIAQNPRVILCSYGDMLRVPGTHDDLLTAKARGADVRIVYSPSDALALAREHSEREIVFFAVGFETTAPATAIAMRQARELALKNFSVLCAHVSVPPVLSWLMEQTEGRPDAFLAPGHVCAVSGVEEYDALAKKYRVPMAVTGFEAVDLLNGILECVRTCHSGQHEARNSYVRCVRAEGNRIARAMMNEVLEPVDRHWRGLGLIPHGGFDLKGSWKQMDARYRFSCEAKPRVSGETSDCLAGRVLRGLLKPSDCPFFGKECTPLTPKGAPMVSGEGACAAYYRYRSPSPTRIS